MNFTPASNLTNQDKGTIKMHNPQELHTKFEDKPVEQPKPEISYSKQEEIKKQEAKKVMDDSSSDSSEEAPPQPIKPLGKQTIAMPLSTPVAKQPKKTSDALKEKQANAQKINMLVQDYMSFGDTSEESDIDSDEFDDHMSEMRPNGKNVFKRAQTAIPEGMNFDCSPSEMLDDFFDDPLEHPLMPTNKFVKHKSEVVKPIGMLRTHKSIMDGLGPKKSRDDGSKIEKGVKPPDEKMKRLEDDDDELK